MSFFSKFFKKSSESSLEQPISSFEAPLESAPLSIEAPIESEPLSVEVLSDDQLFSAQEATTFNPYITADFTKSYPPSDAEHGKFVVADTTSTVFSGYPSAGSGKYAMLTYDVGDTITVEVFPWEMGTCQTKN